MHKKAKVKGKNFPLLAVGISGAEVKLLSFLTSALDRRVLSTSRSRRFDTMAASTCTHSVGGWVGSRNSLGLLAKKNKSVDPAWCRKLYQPSSSLFIILSMNSMHKIDTLKYSVGNEMCDRRRGIN